MDRVFFASSILTNFLLIFFLIKRVNYIYFLPFLAFAGKWLVYLVPNIHFVFYSYWELLLSTIIIFRYFNIQKSQNSLFLFGLGLMAMLPFINIRSLDGLITHFFYLYLFFCALAYYNYFLATSHKIHSGKAINAIAITWVSLSFFYRYVCTIDYQTNLLFIRGGSSLWASNHNGMILLMFLPLIKNKYVKIVVILALVTFFSRGIYLCLIIYALFNIKKVKLSGTTFKYIGAVAVLLYVLLFTPLIDKYKNFLILRFIGGSSITNDLGNVSNIEINSGIDFDAVWAVLESDDRNEIKRVSFTIIGDYNYFGTGFGNFQNAVKQIDDALDYSNAHNLYITLIAETGVCFFFFFMLFYFYNVIIAYKINRDVYMSLIIFLIFGFFSAQIYEEASDKGMIDFIYLLFLFSFCNITPALKETRASNLQIK